MPTPYGGSVQPPPNAPSGPSAPAFQQHSGFANSAPRTPNHGLVPPADELPTVGHGDKVKREAGELVEDVKEVREGGDRDRDRYDSGGRREDRYRDRDGDKYDSGRRSRYEDEGSRRDRRYE